MILLLPWLPMLAALFLLLVPKENEALLKKITVVACALPALIVLYMFLNYDASVAGYQFVYKFNWVPSLGISYQVGVDGINLTLCLLHALVSVAGAFVSCTAKERIKEYLFFYLILVGAIYGVFTVLDIFFLYFFYETTLIPLYPMIGVWGSKNKEYGAMKLTLFITTGAVLALFGLMSLYQQMGSASFDVIALKDSLASAPLSLSYQKWITPFLLIGFGVMASLWPLHSWSPIGYAAAPTSVSMLHAGVLKKMGPYIILRVVLPLLPEGVLHWSHVLAILAGIGIIYAGYAAIHQKDLKFIIGFSSVSHMGYILLAIATMNTISLSGAVLLIFSHGVMAAATFALIGFIYEQTHAREVSDYGGLSKTHPFFAICFIVVCMASLGLPGFSNFASELLVFIGSWNSFPVIVGFAIFGVLITSIYLLRAVKKMCYGPANNRWPELRDLKTFSERFPIMLLIGALLLFGFWPQGLLRIIEPAVGAILS